MDDLSEGEIGALTRIAGLIIPASAAHGVPGGDDPAIMEGVVAGARRDPAAVRAALAAFEASEGAETFRRDHPAHAAKLQTFVALAYYRDPRVLRSLGAPARAPFPEGYEVEGGDERLTDPARARGPVWRKAE